MKKYITYPCQIDIFIFDENSFYKPMPPYTSHTTLEKALEYQKKKYPKNKIEIIIK